MRKKKPFQLTPELIQRYVQHLREEERAENTIQRYVHSLTVLLEFLNGTPLTKAALLEWKSRLTDSYAPTSVNAMLAAVNGFLSSLDRRELCVKLLKIQRSPFTDGSRELTRQEYVRLVRTAERQGNLRLSLAIQTICATGIRVSELKFITAEAVRVGRAEIASKGKRRTVFLPGNLRRALTQYLGKRSISSGAVFVTRSGKPIDRSNIWREMKSLCDSAGVEQGKVFPHNLRHLFARTYYTLEKDLSRLADLLGHSSVATTRIYTAESGLIHARQIERLGLIIT